LKLNNILVLNCRVCDLGVLISILVLLYGVTIGIIWVKELVLIVSFLGLIYLLGDKESKTFFDLTFIHYLGTISYGIYIYHPLVSYPLRFLAGKMIDVSTFSQLGISLIYFLLLFGITVFVSHLSYHFIEKKLFYKTQ
jgi:peptidoglycan/LPS O-acetylase OafA/YrhL